MWATHNIDTDESDKDALTRKIANGDGDTDNSNNELAGSHPGSTDEKKPTTTEALDTPDTGQRHEHVDNICRNSDEEAVLYP